MDETSHANANEGATNSDTDTLASYYALTAYHHQPEPLASVPPPSSAGGAAFLPVPSVPASHGDDAAYPAAIQLPLSDPHDIALHQQPLALGFAPPSSAAGAAAFLPLPVSQGGVAAAYPAAAIPAPLSNPHEIAFHQQQQQEQRRRKEQLQAFWAGQLAKAEEAAEAELKVHSLPLARIKKIMKADEDVKMIAAEAPVVFAKACEMFALELTLRAWLHTQATKRRTLQRSDVNAVINATEAYDFLLDITPEEEAVKGDEGAVASPPPPPMTTTTAVPVPAPMVPSSYSSAPTSSVPFAMYANMKYM